MATVEKLIEAKPIVPHPYKANPSCFNCGKVATQTVVIDNGDVMISRQLCQACRNEL